MTTTNSPANVLEIAIAREPRLAAMGNKQLQGFVASLMVAQNMDYDAAMEQFLGLINSANTFQAEIKESVQKKRDETEKQVTETLRDLVLETMKSLDTAPQYGVTIFYDPRYSFKNSDGTPMMDEKNNPVVAPFVDFKFQWDNKAKSGTRTIGDTSNMGRPAGDYLIDGKVYKSMAAFAKENFADEFGKFSGTSRDFMTSKGYVVPTEPDIDAEGKPHFNVTKSADTTTQAAA